MIESKEIKVRTLQTEAMDLDKIKHVKILFIDPFLMNQPKVGFTGLCFRIKSREKIVEGILKRIGKTFNIRNLERIC